VGGPLRIGHECLAARTPFPPERIPVVGSLTIDNINSFALWMKASKQNSDALSIIRTPFLFFPVQPLPVRRISYANMGVG
jgi:hypothetical protein